MAMAMAAAAVVTAICSTAFVGNELSGGRMSEAMGFGHHHVMDDVGHHCPGMGGAMQNHTMGSGGGMMQNHTMHDRQQCEAMMDRDGAGMGGR